MNRIAILGKGGAILMLSALLAVLALPLVAGADEAPIFASVRIYDGIDPATQSQIAQVTAEGFLPIMRASDGFVGYFLMPAEDMLAAVSLFETPEQAAASRAAARDFVAENLSPLLPNPPTAHEGLVGLHVRGDMTPGALSSLHASLRVYDDYDLAHFDEAIELANSLLVPDLLAIDGFFAQYTLAAGEDNLVAISIYDSPTAAAQANESAIAFSREYVSQWSPHDPTGFSSDLAVAALADIQEGSNLVAREVFSSIRVYAGIDPADHPEIQRVTAEGFLPIMRASDGFVGYYLLPDGDMLAAVSLFETAEQAAAATEGASEFVAENLAALLPNPPIIFEGTLDISYLMRAKDRLSQGMSSLYASLRLYHNYDLTNRAAEVNLVARILLPQQQAAGGLFSYLTMHDGIDRLVALSVYESEANALASNTLAADFVAEYLAESVPEDPVRVNGQLGIVALAELGMGENLVSMMSG
ncbi:MAG: hypothetical protein OXG92_11645 [Chloroflexi bacterium]|nr:hypothetical protein [Chloroflexota bacterium]MCY3582398.1 hypothetical protein [Chloroflexota bacterium]MCY3717108.1 hypothetical protein [Chloroflexota bacterium]MDE2650813.1 hypothetical protein [Chloroflexota bacterium]MXX51756.1 hypothetical protein [Chloroflexota bacterium]